MKKLIFKYGAMNAGKSMHLIMTYYNYEQLGLRPVAVIPDFLGKKSRYIHSRTGSNVAAINYNELSNYLEENEVGVILVDEAQFLSEDQVRHLSDLTITKDISVICYGLRTNSFEDAFQGSRYLLALADELEELPTMCKCGKKLEET